MQQLLAKLSAEYKMVKSAILKNKKELKCVQVAKGISRLSKSCCNFIEVMENLVLV